MDNIHSVSSNAVAEVFANFWNTIGGNVLKAGLYIDHMAMGVCSIRWYWEDDSYYFFRTNGTNQQIQFGFVDNGYEHIYRTI